MAILPPHDNPLYQMEMETLEEGREWMRKRLEQKLQRHALAEGQVSPPQSTDSAQHPVPAAQPDDDLG